MPSVQYTKGVALLDGLEYDIQLLFSRFLGWLLLLFPHRDRGGDLLRVVMKRRPIGVSLAWLALIYAIPFAGVGFTCCLARYASAASGRSGPRPCTVLTPSGSASSRASSPALLRVGSKARPLHDLIQGRLAMPMLSGNRMTLLHKPKSIVEEIVRDIRAPPNPVIWSSTSGTPAGMWTRCARR